MFYLLQTDGACLGNPGPTGLGAILYNTEKKIVFKTSIYNGLGTNNEAEYCALIIGLEKTLENNIENILIKMDSELIVKQINGQYKVKNERLLILYQQVIKLLNKFKNYKIEHVLRKFNQEADELASEAVQLGKEGKLKEKEDFYQNYKNFEFKATINEENYSKDYKHFYEELKKLARNLANKNNEMNNEKENYKEFYNEVKNLINTF